MPADITPDALDKETREGLLSMPRDLAELVAVHLLAAERALGEEDPDRAYEHAKVARRFGSRVGVVREAAGVAAYRAGHFAEALNDLRAARRLTGSDELLPLIADCERGLGRPERALDLVRSPEAERAGRAVQIELAIVESGARRDLGQKEAAVVTLQRLPELRDTRPHPWSARLAFAYADALADAGHEEAATDWFSRAMDFDVDGETDAAVRYAELTGLAIEDIEEDVESLGAESGDGDEPGVETVEAREDGPAEGETDDSREAADDVVDVKDASSGTASGEDPADEGSAVPAGESGDGGSDDIAADASAVDADDLPLDEEVRAKAEADEPGEPADQAKGAGTGSDDAETGETPGTGPASAVNGAIGLGPAFIEPDFGDDAHDLPEQVKREA